MSEREALAEALHAQHLADLPQIPEQVAAFVDPFAVEECRNCQRYAGYLARLLADAEQRGRDAELNERIQYGIKNGSLTEYALAQAEQRGAARVAAAVEALAEEFESEVDWSAGRWDYGDNAAWTSAAERLRAALATGAAERVRAEEGER